MIFFLLIVRVRPHIRVSIFTILYFWKGVGHSADDFPPHLSSPHVVPTGLPPCVIVVTLLSSCCLSSLLFRQADSTFCSFPTPSHFPTFFLWWLLRPTVQLATLNIWYHRGWALLYFWIEEIVYILKKMKIEYIYFFLMRSSALCLSPSLINCPFFLHPMCSFFPWNQSKTNVFLQYFRQNISYLLH